MAKAIAGELLEIFDEHADKFETWTYMTATTLLMRLYHEPEPVAPAPVEYRYVGYGASARVLCADYDRLTANHNRLKNRQKKARKRWRETEEALRQQVDELLAEIQYLEQR
jgi:hypothetical protein